MPSDDATPTEAERVKAQWLLIAAKCRAAASSLPDVEEPDIIPLCHGDEWKEGIERNAIEDSSCSGLPYALSHWRETGEWDGVSKSAGHFIADRLEWAAQFAELLGNAPSDCGKMTAGPAFPSGTAVRDVVHWLACDIYPQYSPSRLARWGDRRQHDY